MTLSTAEEMQATELESSSGNHGGTWPVHSGSCRIQPFYCGLIMFGCEMGIPDGHGDRLVTSQFLHGPEVHAFHDQTTNKRVSKAMPGEVINCCIFDTTLKPGSRIVEIVLEF